MNIHIPQEPTFPRRPPFYQLTQLLALSVSTKQFYSSRPRKCIVLCSCTLYMLVSLTTVSLSEVVILYLLREQSVVLHEKWRRFTVGTSTRLHGNACWSNDFIYWCHKTGDRVLHEFVRFVIVNFFVTLYCYGIMKHQPSSLKE